MDTKSFEQSIGDLASSLGDPTRRGIYVAVRENPDPVSAAEIATLFEIHPNVARHHLDRLAADGYLRVTRKRPSGKTGPGAGRPAKCYEATSKEIVSTGACWPGMEADADTRQLLTSHCPFGDTAANHPEIVCKIDQGIVSGMLETVSSKPVVVHPHEQPDEVCVTDL